MSLFGDEPGAAFDDTEKAADVAGGLVEFEGEQGLYHPRLMDFCIGHEEQEQDFISLFNAGRMPHGLIFSGPRGVGKATMAYRLAKFLLKYGGVENSVQDAMFVCNDLPSDAISLDVARDDQVARLVSASAHPDLLTIERAYDEGKNRYKDAVDVASIRKVTPFLRMTSSEGSYRIVIIDDADTMNRSAQNALLKILEEPPEKTIIILVTHRLGALIPTIRSRTRLVNFAPLDKTHFEALLERSGEALAPCDLENLVALSDGSIGSALEYIEQGGLEIFDKLLALYNEQAMSGVNWADVHAIADELSKAGQDRRYTLFCKLLQWLYHSLMVSKARNRALPKAISGLVFQDIMAKSSLDKLIQICDKLGEHFASVKHANLDKRQGVLGAFSLISV